MGRLVFWVPLSVFHTETEDQTKVQE
jgi:hypothetical protein